MIHIVYDIRAADYVLIALNVVTRPSHDSIWG